MKIFRSLFFTIIIFQIFQFSFVFAKDKPLSIVIVGAGPSGLATAIEAHNAGAEVILIEERTSYTRDQIIFLFENSLEILKKWAITTPALEISKMNENQNVGLIPIADLERILASHVEERKILRIQGKFSKIMPRGIEVITEDTPRIIPYDILVGADGAHSDIRKELRISCKTLGSSCASISFMTVPTTPGKVTFPKANLYEDFYIKRLLIPEARIIIAQKTLHPSKSSHTVVHAEDFQKIAKNFGWKEEEKLTVTDKAIITKDISILLQQAETFSDASQSVILVGDAAAVAPFIQGQGANYSLKSAKIAGHFFTKYQKEKEMAYEDFNREMQEATDEMLEDSKYLLD